MYINKITKKKIAIGLSIALAIILIISNINISTDEYINEELKNQIEKAKANEQATAIIQEKITILKNNILADLKHCESGDRTESDALIIMDTNKKLSYGLYQFQINTVKHYTKLLENKDITNYEATLKALSETESKKLAKDIIFSHIIKDGINNWHNCNKKHNLKIKIDYIKQIEQEIVK